MHIVRLHEGDEGHGYFVYDDKERSLDQHAGQFFLGYGSVRFFRGGTQPLFCIVWIGGERVNGVCIGGVVFTVHHVFCIPW